MEMIKAYFQAMQSMNCGKAASLFFEKAEELNNILVLGGLKPELVGPGIFSKKRLLN